MIRSSTHPLRSFSFPFIYSEVLLSFLPLLRSPLLLRHMPIRMPASFSEPFESELLKTFSCLTIQLKLRPTLLTLYIRILQEPAAYCSKLHLDFAKSALGTLAFLLFLCRCRFTILTHFSPQYPWAHSTFHLGFFRNFFIQNGTPMGLLITFGPFLSQG